ncbi:MAG: rhomboid family intramembrane serine protease [Chloroflexi bacterium AL-W]|nr:rhomboid family intramembrane serine protease [Chloroflexi bacterium AL-N1]NOK66675.1 rhomboid family intramembrane serine protease [Chloroflexi bacterium AL-N10]NOK72063.1 rhomboid family intramembrane serine protease [Chloroflexi bacterium AL-N5]NOK81320.1 rhomboid family intramembrane serine protease [Chloroflexi bacterium AL-W]NOK89593.1 rhomboid family intramembrane serine protease [Chloroflexi bacterium AL-N15]
MIPIGDNNPTRRYPIINHLLIAINILAFIYELSLGQRGLNEFIATWGVRSVDVIALIGGEFSLLIPVLQQSLVSMFLHGGWLHIGSNLLFLWIFGDNVEDNFGSFSYLIFYLLCGFGAVLAQAFLTPNSPVPSIGASGAISGVMGAYLLMYPTASIRALLPIFFFIPVLVPAWAMIIFWFVSQLLNGYASLTEAAQMMGGIAYGAHIGGFVVGFILTFFFRTPERRPRYRYQPYTRR